MKKIFALLLALSLIFCLSACGGVSSSSIEGAGFSSSEDAAMACASALAEGNAAKVMSTFAMETYLKNYDLEKYLDRYKSYIPGSNVPLPSHNAYTDTVNLANRQYEIAKAMSNMYLCYTLGEDAMSNAIFFAGDNPEQTPAEFIDSVDNSFWKNMKVNGVLYSEDFDVPDKFHESAVAPKLAYLNCDELIPLAVELTIDGEDYYLFMEVARYGRKWYALSFQGSLAAVKGVSTLTGGLVPVDTIS